MTPSRPAAVAAIDCGTNTIKLLIRSGGEQPHDLVREARMVRLGQDVDRTGRLAEQALARTFAAVDEYAALIGEFGAERVRFCATSATRDAANAEVFRHGVRERLGVEPEVIGGEAEAALAFAGAVRGLRTTPDWPVLVLDVGGGSTELVLGDAPDRGGVRAAHSMQIGSVRLHERHVADDPPTPEQVAAVVADIDAALDACPVDPTGAGTVVGVAGTVTTLVAGVLDLPAYDREAIDQSVLGASDVHDLTMRLVAMPRAERLALPWLHPGRADVIDAGALIVDRVLARSGAASMLVSESDILDGIAWSLAR
ncbi:Ppx/GppA phosphatase family protein [Nocardioides sp. GXZ039]|uniref:Ppx/GppA phosphatase family protein n=1 Tax=Nocardioides sp. GXZ039 TaxID=3136018 RepID=UPI0030F3C911